MKEKETERILKALANRRRLAMVKFIRKEKEASVGDIAGEIKLSFKSTSRHLAVLAAADIIEREQRGIEGFYRLTEPMAELTRRIISIV